MSQLDQLRSEAAALEAQAKASGQPIQHCAVLEQVARRHGYESWRACLAVLRAAPPPDVPSKFPTRLYESADWGFRLDVPERWNTFPALPTNSPYEVVRFASHEYGNHLLIVFREPRDPEQDCDEHLALMQAHLETGGFGGFAGGETTIGGAPVRTLDFHKAADGEVWSCRHYILAADTLRYVLGFGTNRREAMTPLFEAVASTFAFDPLTWA